MKARVYAIYSDGCFCDRPKLNAEVYVPMDPVFKFARAARDVADGLKAEQFRLNKRSTGRSAYAVIPHACNHRDKQAVRIQWELYY